MAPNNHIESQSEFESLNKKPKTLIDEEKVLNNLNSSDSIRIIHQSDYSVHYSLKGDEMLYYQKNWKEFQTFLTYLEKSHSRNSSRTCAPHIMVTGQVMSGKTTFAKHVLPYYASRGLKYDEYQVDYVDLSCYQKDKPIVHEIFKTISKDELIINIEKFAKFLESKRNKLFFLILDEINTCSDSLIEELSTTFKNRSLYPNLISIWCEGTPSLTYEKLMKHLNGQFGLQTNVMHYHISLNDNEQEIEDFRLYLNQKHGKVVVTEEVLSIFKNVFGFVNSIYLEQIASLIIKEDLSPTQAILNFCNRIFERYDRDILPLLWDCTGIGMRESVILGWKETHDIMFSAVMCNNYIYQTFFKPLNDSKKCIIRDCLIDRYLPFKYGIKDIFGIEERNEKLDMLFFEMFPLMVIGQHCNYFNLSFFQNHEGKFNDIYDWIRSYRPHWNEKNFHTRTMAVFIGIGDIISNHGSNYSKIRQEICEILFKGDENSFHQLIEEIRRLIYNNFPESRSENRFSTIEFYKFEVSPQLQFLRQGLNLYYNIKQDAL